MSTKNTQVSKQNKKTKTNAHMHNIKNRSKMNG